MAYREVLEVAKWTSAKDVARWSVNSTWRRVLESEELWRVLVEEITGQQEVISLPGESYKRWFRRVIYTCFSRPLFSSTSFRVFHSYSRSWSPVTYLSEEINWDMSSAYVLLDDERVLVCGGGAETRTFWSSVHRVEREGRVEKLENLREGRAFHGMIKVEECVYVLCGLTTSCARLHLPSLHWDQLPSVSQVLSRVMACHYLGSIYLPAQLCMFVYELTQGSWTEVRMEEKGPSIAVVWREGLELVSRTSAVRWPHGESRLHEKWANVWGNATPIVCGDTLYLPWGQLLQRIDLLSLTTTFLPTCPSSAELS